MPTPEQSLVPVTPTEYREAVYGLAQSRGSMTDYALMKQDQLQAQMDIWFKQAEELNLIRMIYLLVRLGGTVTPEGILVQIREPGLVIDLAYVSASNSHLVTVNGNTVMDTKDAGAIKFIPGPKWIPAVIGAFKRLTAEGAFRSAQTEELTTIELIRTLSADV